MFLECRKPTIAAVNGAAVGIGMDFALLCDIRIASEHAKFSQLFVKLGPDGRHHRLLAAPAARRATPWRPSSLFTGDIVDATEARAHRPRVAGVSRPTSSLPGRPRPRRPHRGQPAAGRAPHQGRAAPRRRAGPTRELPEVVVLRGQRPGPPLRAREDHKEAAAAFMEKRRPCSPGADATGRSHARPRRRPAAPDRQRHVADVPDRVAMLDVDGPVGDLRASSQDTYRTWAGRASGGSASEPGDNVVTMLPNSFEPTTRGSGVAWLRRHRGAGQQRVPRRHAALPARRLAGRGARASRSGSSTALVGVAADLDHLAHRRRPRRRVGDDLPDLPVRRARPGRRVLRRRRPGRRSRGPGALRHRRARSTPRAPPARRRACSCRGPSSTSSLRIAARRHDRRRRRLLHRVPGVPRVGEVGALHRRRATVGTSCIRETFSLTEFWDDIRALRHQGGRARRPDGGAAHARCPSSPTTPTTRSSSVFMGPLIPQVEEFKEPLRRRRSAPASA